MAYPTDVVATGDLITAAQINRWCVLLADTTLSGAAASVDLTSIPAHWTNLALTVYARGTSAFNIEAVRFRLNNDTAGNYDFQTFLGNNAGVSAAATIAATSGYLGDAPDSTATANMFSMHSLEIVNYAGTANNKASYAHNALKASAAAASLKVVNVSNFWRSNTAVDRITVFMASGNLDAGTRVSLYGMGRI